jgi:hypothetical protein
MKMLRILAVLVLATLTPHVANAYEWLYCIAPFHAEHKLYMSPVFATQRSVGRAETAFATALDQSFFRYDDVQCPRNNDELSALRMQRHTASFNREVGNTIIDLRWKPKS